jgi:hypothetical protein
MEEKNKKPTNSRPSKEQISTWKSEYGADSLHQIISESLISTISSSFDRS